MHVPIGKIVHIIICISFLIENALYSLCLLCVCTYTMFSNSAKALSLLLEKDADVNSKDTNNESTALMVSAALGHDAVTRVLLAHPLLNIHAGVRD